MSVKEGHDDAMKPDAIDCKRFTVYQQPDARWKQKEALEGEENRSE